MEGWEILAQAVNLHHGMFFCHFSVLAEVMQKARREDLRSIWDAVAKGPWRTGGSWTVQKEMADGSFATVKRFSKSGWAKQKNEKNWNELVKYLEEAKERRNCCSCSLVFWGDSIEVHC